MPFDALNPGEASFGQRLLDQPAANPSPPIAGVDAYTDAAAMSKTFSRVTCDLAPADYLRGVGCNEVDAAALDRSPYGLVRNL